MLVAYCSLKLIDQTCSKKDTSIIDDKGVIISDQEKNCNQFNNFFVNIGLNIDKTIPNSKRNFKEYLHQIKVNKSFCLIPTIPEEIFDIITSLDMKYVRLRKLFHI